DTTEIGGLRIGVASDMVNMMPNDPEYRTSLAASLDCDILVTGGGQLSVQHEGGRLYLSPGSITGVGATGLTEQGEPTFILMDIAEQQVTVFIYRLVKGKMKVSRKPAFSLRR
ncbi:vacuolar protein sorting-associated protein 29, Vps29, partial [Kipferlia bialata]